jgi:hypothetical protein
MKLLVFVCIILRLFKVFPAKGYTTAEAIQLFIVSYANFTKEF